MTDERSEFEAFMKQREGAAGAYVSGDGAPLAALVAQASPATFFGPRGGTVQGASEVSATYLRDVAAFAPGSENRFEVLHMEARDGLGYWVGIQHASARMRGQAEPVPFRLRITEIFRREDGAWKLVHRHADPLSEPAAPPR